MIVETQEIQHWGRWYEIANWVVLVWFCAYSFLHSKIYLFKCS